MISNTLEVSQHVVEHFSKHYGMTHEIVIVVIDKSDGAAHLSGTIPPERAIEEVSKVLSGAILSGGLMAARNKLAQWLAKQAGGS